MKILIVEDEYLFFLELKKLLLEINPAIEILGNVTGVDETVNWLLSNDQPDLIFLDIQLTDGMSFEIFDKVKIKCPVIFTTSFDNYAIKAFDLNSIDYIIKPVDKEKLTKSLSKYQDIKNYFSKDDIVSELKKVYSSLKSESESYKQRLLIYKGDQLVSVETNEIAYFYSEEKATIVTTKGSQRYQANSSLDELEKQLNPKVFFRANRQFILNIQSIVKTSTYFNYRLKVEVKPPIDKEIFISREKAQAFRDWLDL